MKPARDGIRLHLPGVRPTGVRPTGVRPTGVRPRRGVRHRRPPGRAVGRRWRFRGPAVQGPLWALLALGLALACSGSLPGPVSRPPPPDVPVDAPPPAEPAPPIRPPDRRAPEPPVATGPLVLWVGLATDLKAVTLPCCDPGVALDLDGVSWPVTGAATVAPAGTVTERAVYRLQVAALKDELQAAGIADYLTQTTDWPADAIFDADTDLYRVRVGRFAGRGEAETGRGALEALGIGESWITSEGGSIQNPAFEVTQGGRPAGDERRTVAGRWLDVSAAGGSGIRILDGRFRGRILVYLNDRGLLNVINEIELEEYLRGVVPMEMGPELYNAPEALKAQAVAARTFAVKNLDGFAQEGYDICSTPRCQVYGGMTVEHPRSDAAVRDTAGQVALVFGEPAETFYSATCGGHTENVEVVFPLKRGAHLRGVPCLEAGAATLAGDLRPGAPWPAGLTRRLLPPAPGSKRSRGSRHRVLSARLEHLALLAALPVPRDRLRSLARREVLRFVTSVFDLALDRRLLSSAEELRALADEPPDDWQTGDRSFARYLADHLLSDTAPRDLSDAEVEELLYRLALHLGVLDHERTRYLTLDQGRLTVRLGAERRTHRLPAELATFRRRGGVLTSGPLELMAGDRLDFYWRRGDLVALVQPVEARKPHLDGRAPRQSWSRFKTRRQVATAVQARYPGFPFEGFEVLSRGVSGRVGKLKLLGSDGRSLLVEGLAVRWTLDLHDTLFDAQPARPDGREAGWFFRGRGWGHGVGMCQAGAYGMAVRGNSYRAILEHYYTGIELGRLKPVPARPRLGSAPR